MRGMGARPTCSLPVQIPSSVNVVTLPYKNVLPSRKHHHRIVLSATNIGRSWAASIPQAPTPLSIVRERSKTVDFAYHPPHFIYLILVLATFLVLE